jgi:hypothetical protein
VEQQPQTVSQVIGETLARDIRVAGYNAPAIVWTILSISVLTVAGTIIYINSYNKEQY